ncbi:hypothetical protein CTAYLR_000967 [Chrysophaeum taylorii]|uniref:Lipase maturation factor 2 n=1 Tax=Chrysophaeum taylorii TaxID=2483200 RepID=A0AAD7XQ33_9STRA|nr:hypothetical protein CTAYLR_000967 [Chrysophaeum taylorii]
MLVRRCLGGVYVCAFVSFWLQYPGLLGEDGLAPCGCGDDFFVSGVAVLGAAAGGAALGGLAHPIVMGVAFACYLKLYSIGQSPWLSFQWDILLLEAGAAAIVYDPWIFRLATVKLMVMSGVVKVTANCPTWKHLTALEYHFASTCLPTAEAWWFHSLPPPLLRLGVAFMFLTELVAPWLLLAPVTAVRRVGVVVQVALQVAIQLTGNYNFFNALTAAMALAAWTPDFAAAATDRRVAEKPIAAAVAERLVLAGAAWERAWERARVVTVALSVAALAVAFAELFPVEATSALFTSRDTIVRNLITPDWTEAMLRTLVSRAGVAYVYAAWAASTLADASTTLVGRPAYARFAGRILRAAWCGAYMGLILLPFRSITNRDMLPLIPPPIDRATAALALRLEPLRVSSSYGLFRRMTGVGPAPNHGGGFGGLPPSVPAVPVVVLETSSDGANWTEVKFRYAPGDPRRPPRRTAPHQPRLDWQMWFAALGTYHHNPWFVHLCYKLLRGTPSPALDLLEEPPRRVPKLVRAWLYHYDFTRVPTPWAIPSNTILSPDCFRLKNAAAAAKEDDCGLYWARAKVREYFPAVDETILLDQVVRPQGWPESPPPPRPPPRHPLSRLGYEVDSRLDGLRRFKSVAPYGLLRIDGPLLIIILSLVAPFLLGAVVYIVDLGEFLIVRVAASASFWSYGTWVVAVETLPASIVPPTSLQSSALSAAGRVMATASSALLENAPHQLVTQFISRS